MNIDQLFESNYLKSSDFPEPRTVTIHSIEVEEMRDGKNKPVLYLREKSGARHKRGLILNKTNANAITKLLGKDTDGWIGKQVTFEVRQVEFGSDIVDGIRVRLQDTPRQRVAEPPPRDEVTPAPSYDDEIPF